MGSSSAFAGLVGACCLPDGSCIETDEISCVTSNGVFEGESTDCANVACETLTGGCCLPDGSCESLTFEDCTAGGGLNWVQGVDCGNACPGACCLFEGGGIGLVTCEEVGQVDCDAQGGYFQGNGTLCDDTDCTPFGACCAPDGTCTTAFEADCIAAGGSYQGNESQCANVTCEVLIGACCASDGSCVDAVELDCVDSGGTFQGSGNLCSPDSCVLPTGACCADDGSCTVSTGNDCVASGGSYLGDGTTCTPNLCPQPPAPGACCLPSGTCDERVIADCAAAGGTFQGEGVACADVSCPLPPDDFYRGSGTEKGSVLVIPDIELRWAIPVPNVDVPITLQRDCFISLTNDYPGDVRVLMYFLNGDEPLEATPSERAHPGWNFVDNEITLTANQPVRWSVATGEGTVPVSPFTVLDPGFPPGRPALDGSDAVRMLRGCIYMIAVNDQGQEINWNHLGATLTIVDYERAEARDIPAIAFQSVNASLATGDVTGTPGDLNFDGIEFAQAPSQVLWSFQAYNSIGFSNQNPVGVVQTRPDLTLLPLAQDFRLNGPVTGPVVTKAHFDVWNENEVKFSGMYRCISCWDQAVVGPGYSAINHILVQNLQTFGGKARIDGIASALCEGSVDTAILGVATQFFRFVEVNDKIEASAEALVGMGFQSAVVRFDVITPPDEAPQTPKPATKLPHSSASSSSKR